jgi:hypothetical protein
MEMPVLAEASTVGERRRQGGVGMKVRDPRVSMLPWQRGTTFCEAAHGN